MKLSQIVLSALATGGFISTLLGTGLAGTLFAGIVSTILLVLNAYTKNYDLGELGQKHKQAANDIWLIREKYLTLLTDLAIGERSLKSVTDSRDVLLQDLHSVYAGSPASTDRAYKAAQIALQKNQELTFSDQEIDAFLPKELRRSQHNGA